MKNLLNLFFTMMKIGLFTFGGGYAMIPLLENEFVEKKKYMEKNEFLDMVAIAESTPGPIAINSATYIGYKKFGFWGSFFATLGVCIPSFAIIFLISLFFDAFLEFKLVEYAFRGIQVAVIYLIFNAGLKMFKGLKRNAFNMTVFPLVFVCMLVFALFAVKFSTIFYIIIAGFSAVFLFLIKKISEKEGKK